MITAEAVAVILLAAGASTRFGPRDKLAEPLGGYPLGLHAARALDALPFAARIAVTRPGGPDFAALGYDIVENAEPGAGQSASIRLGVARARPYRPQAVLIALADMPFVTSDHFAALLAAFGADSPVVGSTDGRRPSAPAVFAASTFPLLEALSGDVGARAMLRGARLVTAPHPLLADIDTPADLASSARDKRNNLERDRKPDR